MSWAEADEAMISNPYLVCFTSLSVVPVVSPCAAARTRDAAPYLFYLYQAHGKRLPFVTAPPAIRGSMQVRRASALSALVRPP